MRFFRPYQRWKKYAIGIGIVAILLVVVHVSLALLIESWPLYPGADDYGETNFAVFGDSQGQIAFLWPISSKFDTVVERVNETDAELSFHVGDMYFGDDWWAMSVEAQANQFNDAIEDLDIPLYPVMGNHDARGSGWDVTRERIFHDDLTYYSLNKGDCHFVVLDAFMPEYENSISEEQMAWLEDDLADTRKPHIFVFVHAPLYPVGGYFGEALDTNPELSDRLVSLFVQHGVDAVFCGHEHFYACFEYNGIMQITTGGAGGELRSPADMEELTDEFGYSGAQIDRYVTAEKHHFIYVNTTEEGIEVSVYDLEGDPIDHFYIESR